jgi:3-oxoacid CoA-transferase subunit B
MSASVHENMLRRAAREVRDGMLVNLGIGLPTQVTAFLPRDITVSIHSENGIVGMGPAVAPAVANRNLIDAGGAYVSVLPGGAFFDSAVSFVLVRGGRLDLSILGAFEVSAAGDLANWAIPGRFTPGVGGAVELACKARRIVVLTTHRDKLGRPKLLQTCSLPLTAAGCVDRIITDLAVLDAGPQGFALQELAEGVSVAEVLAATGAPISIPDHPIPRF